MFKACQKTLRRRVQTYWKMESFAKGIFFFALIFVFQMPVVQKSAIGLLTLVVTHSRSRENDLGGYYSVKKHAHEM